MAQNTGVIPGYNYAHITGTTTSSLKSGTGVLHTITVNQPVASSVITIYDNTAGSGTVIGVITLPDTLLSDSVTLTYDVTFTTGLTIVTATAGSDLTVSYV